MDRLPFTDKLMIEDSDDDWTLSMVESNPVTIEGNAPDLMIATAACSKEMTRVKPWIKLKKYRTYHR